jgi:hypothetical protein
LQVDTNCGAAYTHRRQLSWLWGERKAVKISHGPATVIGPR